MGHRSIDGYRGAGDRPQSFNLLDVGFELTGYFLIRRRTAGFPFKLTKRAQKPMELIIHVHGNPHRARLVGEGPRHSLPYPPSGVGRELETPVVIELFRRAHQSNIAFLNKIQEVQPAVDILFRHGNHQAQIGFHKGNYIPNYTVLTDGMYLW